MISIAVCDDSKHIVELLAAKICNILKKKNVHYLVDEYTSGIELLNHIGKYECVFLDIDMPEIGGYEVAERIRSLKRDCCIIMATAQVSNFKPAFALNVFRFITKPFADNEIKEALERFLTKKAMNRTIEAYYKRIKYDIPLSEILYIRAINSEVELITSDKVYRKEISIKDVFEELDRTLFYRCHRSYIINLDKAKMGNKCAWVNGIEIPVSRRNYKDLESEIIRYSMNYK